MSKNVLDAREVAHKVNALATKADQVEAYNTQLYVHIPGIGLRHVKGAHLNDDAHVILKLDFMSVDYGKPVVKL